MQLDQHFSFVALQSRTYCLHTLSWTFWLTPSETFSMTATNLPSHWFAKLFSKYFSYEHLPALPFIFSIPKLSFGSFLTQLLFTHTCLPMLLTKDRDRYDSSHVFAWFEIYFWVYYLTGAFSSTHTQAFWLFFESTSF